MKLFMITHTYKDYYFVRADNSDEALELWDNGYEKDGTAIEIKNSENLDTEVIDAENLSPTVAFLQMPNRALEDIKVPERTREEELREIIDVLWEYISEADIPEIQKQFEELGL